MTALNEHDQESALGQGPLSGVRVLDLTRVYAGPMCTMLLAELGADVIKVEDPTTGDETRGFPPLVQGYSGYYFALNRSKRAVTLDLKNPEGIRLAKELAAASDVLIESFTPGAAERLGIGYGVIAGIKPSIVYCSISGFGQSGPYRTHKGYDPILQAMSGLMSITGERGGGPVKTMLPIADAATALYSAISILAALHHVRDSGEGQYIDMAMLDVMVSMLTTVGTHYLLSGEIPPRSGTENPARVPSAAFECADGRLLQLVPNQRQWPLFCELIGVPELGEDPRFASNVLRVQNQDDLYPLLRRQLLTRPFAEWRDLFDERGIAAGPIFDISEVFQDPQVKHRGLVSGFDHPDLGFTPAITLPIRYSRTPVRIRGCPPARGEDADEVFGEVLGLSAEQIRHLRASGAI